MADIEPRSAAAPLPPLLTHVAPSPELAPCCACCRRGMPWRDWLQHSWVTAGRQWASQCDECRAVDARFAQTAT
jgi:hypothetical protein